MGARLCLLGFSGNTLSLIFNTLKAVGSAQELLIVENLRTEDTSPYDCGLPHRRLWYEDYTCADDDEFFLAVAGASVKSAVYDFFASRFPISHERFVSLIHPAAHVAYQHQFAEGVLIEPGSIVAPFAVIGFGVSLLRGSSIGHHARLEEYVTVSPGATIAGHAHLGAGTTIGAGATVFDHVAIGADSIIGGGSVVNRDIPAGVVAYGNPCRVIRPRTP